ncbi:DUF4132 domain-containing protein [Planomonospora algeriensis]
MARPSSRGGVRQPFKQVFRELYLLTPAEERTGTFSSRFAGHILRYGQARTLLGQRGWTGRSIGNWDYENGGDQGEVVRDLAGWQARWAMHIVSGPGPRPPCCAPPRASPSTATGNRRRWPICRRWCCRKSSARPTSPWAWPRSPATTRR